MTEVELVEITIPDEFLTLCSQWAGDTDCMLRAVDSTGGVSIGCYQIWNDDVERYLTEPEHHVKLWSGLSCDVAYYARMAEKSTSRSVKRDAQALREFKTFCDETIEQLRIAYGLQDSEAV